MMTDPTTQAWEIPHPDSLTMAELDEVLAVTGVDLTEEGMSWGKVVAGILVWWRRNHGEPDLTIDQVYATVRMGQVKVTAVNPTNG